MVKLIFIILVFLVLGFIFAPYLPQVFGGFTSAFTTLTDNATPIVDFLTSLFANILNRPYLMQLVGALLVFAIIGLVIKFLKGDS